MKERVMSSHETILTCFLRIKKYLLLLGYYYYYYYYSKMIDFLLSLSKLKLSSYSTFLMQLYEKYFKVFIHLVAYSRQEVVLQTEGWLWAN
jgi:hypothetical protein